MEWTDIKRHAVEAITKFFDSGAPITTGVSHHESSKYEHHILCTTFSSYEIILKLEIFYLILPHDCLKRVFHISGHSEDADEIVSIIKELLDTRIR